MDENGVEIVLNGLEPIRPKGAPASLDLEEEIVLDTEDDAIVQSGLSDVGSFVVDSTGNIYFAAARAGENTILKFDRQGRPAGSFGRKGQGPGEIQGISALFITDGDELAVTSAGTNRLTIFGPDGKLRREVPFRSRYNAVVPLPNGRFFVWDRVSGPRPGILIEYPMALADADLKTIKVLDTGIIENPMEGERLRGIYHLQSWSVSRKSIFTGH